MSSSRCGLVDVACGRLTDREKRAPFLGRKHKDLKFAFDRVFDENSTQLEVFEESTKNIVECVLDGVNCSVFAYGATGAGKTHTMLGTTDSPGVMFHTMMELYQCIARMRDEKTFEVAVSYCEVYNESIRDLLSCSIDGGSLELREDARQGLVVSNLSKHQPGTAEEILTMLERGNRNRTQHPTDANATSSRSHAVFQVYVHQKPRTAAISTQMTSAKLSLIDLAGSERATVTTNRGARLREGANINKSLLALGNCINALADNKTRNVHVPYRNSKLTRLLKDSLGGNCRTVMIANISPSSLTYEDTYNTLKYADRAKQIKTKVVRNVLNVDYHVSRYRVIVHELQQEIAELKCKLADSRTPVPRKPTEFGEDSKRLQDLVRGVYGERLRLRKHMVDLDTQERETLLRICRKERDLHRIDTLTGNEAKMAKLAAKVSELQQQIVDIERQKQMVHEYLFSNNEAVTRVQREVDSASTDSPRLQELMKEVVQGRKLETENAHHWRQTKHLLRYIKAQEREIGKTERILLLALEVTRKQHTLLKAHNAVTPSLREAFSNLLHAAEGEKGVAWADLNTSAIGQVVPDTTCVVEHHGLSVAQKALFDTFLVHASPARRLSLDKHSPAIMQKPVAGILTKTGSTASNVSSNGSTTLTEGGGSEAGDSGVGCGERRLAGDVLERSVSDASSSVVSSLLSSRVSSIPDKPRMPTPIDDVSSSCSSNNSLYDTRFNTVLNSYHQKPPSSPAVRAAGCYTKIAPPSRGATPTSRDSPQPTPRGTPEPYLTPLPSLHKLTLTRQNSDRYKHLEAKGTLFGSTAYPVSGSSNIYTDTTPSSRVIYSSSSGEESNGVRVPCTRPVPASAFTHVGCSLASGRPHVPPRTATQGVSSDAYMQLIAKATQLPSVPLPSSRLYPAPHTSRHPSTPVSSSLSPSIGKFEDNFVSFSSSRSSAIKIPPPLPPKGMSTSPQQKKSHGHQLSSLNGVNPKAIASGRESSTSSHSSSSTVKSMEPQSVTKSQSHKSPPMVTVETHSTVVNVHPPQSHSSHLPNSTPHSVNIGVNHAHRPSSREPLPSTATTTRSRPPAFVPPPSFPRTTSSSSAITNNTSSTSQSCPTSATAISSITSTATPLLSHRLHTSSSDNNKHLIRDGNSAREGVKDSGSRLNSTFTVVTHAKQGSGSSSSGSSGSDGKASGVGLRRQHGVSFKPVPGALKMLHVNSPHALDERGRANASAVESTKVRRGRLGVPNYLQLTKSAASKRVTKTQNQENGAAHGLKKVVPTRGYRGPPSVVYPVC